MKKDFFNKIENWALSDMLNIAEFIKQEWAYANSGYFKSYWGKAIDHSDALFLELHTGGFSGNERIIKYIEKNKYLFLLFHTKWERGGHYYFEINPKNLGYKKIQETADSIGVSRQMLHRMKDKYEFISVGKKLRTKMCRLKI